MDSTMTLTHQRLYVLALMLLTLLGGPLARGQDFGVSFTPPTNGAAYTAYELYAESTNGAWVGKAWCPAATNKICFKSWELPSNPCRLAIRSKTAETNSVLSDSINFDTRDFVTKTNVLPNPVLPPSFIWVEKL